MKNTTYKVLGLIMLLFVLGACGDFLDVNVSPNSTVSPPARTILAAATGELGFHMGSDIHRFTSEWVQQFTGAGAAGTQTLEYARFNVTATDMNNSFRGGIWGDALSDFQALRLATEGTSPKYSGIAKIAQAFLFSIAVDCWGDLPFTEALKFGANVTPKYDKSEDIYAALPGLIDEGIADLNLPNSLTELVPGADDLIYGGNLSKWIKFGNSLKLRIYIKYYPTNSAFADAQIAALLASGATFMASNADNFSLAFEASVNRTNAIDQFEKSRNNQFWPTTTIVDIMNANADPRRPFYFTASPAAGQYTGLTPGILITTTPATSRMHTYLRGASTPAANGGATGYAGDKAQRMFTFAEHNLNLAEYYARTSQPALAQTAYQAAITASMQDATVAAVDIAAYLAGPKGSLTGTLATDLVLIMTEKYVSNYGVAVQPWSDWRRTNIPTLVLPVGAVLTNLPRILPYSDLERVTNPNTPPRAVADLTSPAVFWDPGN